MFNFALFLNPECKVTPFQQPSILFSDISKHVFATNGNIRDNTRQTPALLVGMNKFY